MGRLPRPYPRETNVPLTLLARLQPVFLRAVATHPRGARAGVCCFTIIFAAAAVAAACPSLVAVEEDARELRPKLGPRTTLATSPAACPARVLSAPSTEGDIAEAAGMRDDVADQARGVLPPWRNVPKAVVAVDHALPDIWLGVEFCGASSTAPEVLCGEQQRRCVGTGGSTPWGQ